MNTISICTECNLPAETNEHGLCSCCQWMQDKDALCRRCDNEEMVECNPDGVECLAGGRHCVDYHHECCMTKGPSQLPMWE